MIQARERTIGRGDQPGRGGEGGHRKECVQSPERPSREPAQEAQTADRILQRLSTRVGAEGFGRYFKHQTLVRYAAGRLEVVVPTGFVADLIGRRFGTSLVEAAREELGQADAPVEVSFRVDGSAFGSAGSTGASGAHAAQPPPPPPSPAVRPAAGSALSGRYRLEDFVVGEANRLAFNAAERLAEPDCPRSLSPLFIYGECGLGKTHLLQGASARFRERRPGARVLYLTAEAFTNDYIAAVRSGRIDGFRKTYRGVDLLCLDDVQFFSSKQQTQTELLHTFDAIDLSGARVMLASDEHPRQVRKFSTALVSRFMSGMVVRLDPPESALRERIVARLAERRGLRLDKQACALVAAHCGGAPGLGGSVREIEGAITRIDALRYMQGSTDGPSEGAGLIMIRKALGLSDGAPVAGRPRRPVRVEQILLEVCRTLHVEHSELLGRGRHKRVVLARTLAAHLCRALTTLSFPEIARAMGRPNHSTVVTACKRMQEQIKADAALDLGQDCVPELGGLTARTLADQIREDILRSAP